MADAIFGVSLLVIVLLVLLAAAVSDGHINWKKRGEAEKENDRLRGLFIDERRRAEKAEAERNQATEHVGKCTATREELRARAAQYQADLARQAVALSDIRKALSSLKGGTDGGDRG